MKIISQQRGGEGVNDQKEIAFYKTEDVARLLQCSVVTAREIMRRADFPLIRVGKNLRVSKLAFEEWAMGRRT